MYRYLLWDIDGTVLNFLAAEKAAIKALFLKFGFGECTDEMIAEYSAINVKYWQMLERNEMTKPEILVARFQEFFEKKGIDVSKAHDFNEEYQVALGDTIVFCDNALDVLTKEKENYTLVAITNGTAVAQNKKLSASGLNEVFDYVFISEEVGYEKPNREYFEFVLKEVGIQSVEDVLIIGDSLTSDIKGGLNMGIDTCWYNPSNIKLGPTDLQPTYIITDLNELSEKVL